MIQAHLRAETTANSLDCGSYGIPATSAYNASTQKPALANSRSSSLGAKYCSQFYTVRVCPNYIIVYLSSETFSSSYLKLFKKPSCLSGDQKPSSRFAA